MKAFDSVLKIKKAVLELSKIMPPEEITIKTILEKAKVSRATFYKHFENIEFLWHTISHDCINSMMMQYNSLELAPNCLSIPVQKNDIIRLSKLSSVSFSDYMTNFLYQNRGFIKILTSERGDPFFVRRWNSLTAEILATMLKNSGYPMEQSSRMSQSLSAAYVKGCLDGIAQDNKNGIFDTIITVLDITYKLCENKTCAELYRRMCN